MVNRTKRAEPDESLDADIRLRMATTMIALEMPPSAAAAAELARGMNLPLSEVFRHLGHEQTQQWIQRSGMVERRAARLQSEDEARARNRRGRREGATRPTPARLDTRDIDAIAERVVARIRNGLK